MPFTSVTPPPRADASPDAYAAIRLGLEHAEYSQPAVCEYFHLKDFADFFEGHAPTDFSLDIGSPLGALSQLFLLGRSLEDALLRAQLGDAFVDACVETGLLLASDAAPSAWIASAALYPLKEIWIASDRVVPLPGMEGKTHADVVYPAATRSAGMFLTLMPRRACGRFLEVCGGCGPAALLGGEFADESTASDLEPRSAAFAAFNGRLLNLDNFRSIAGSYYDGTVGLYDVIAAHPPYMPSLGGSDTYYGGGKDGTEILRGLLAQLPGKLAPGGLFYAVAMIPQGPSASLEQNVRRWIGDQAPSFDVFSFPHRNTSVHDLALSVAVKNSGGMQQLFRFEQELAGLGHSEFVLGALIVRRHSVEEPPINIRRKLAPQCGWRELLWCVDWECAAKEPGLVLQLMDHPVRVRPEFELHATHKPSPEGLPPVRFQAITQYPFAMESDIQDWMSYLFARADGSLTGAGLMKSLIDDQLLHPETPTEAFAQLLRTFVSGAFLETPICPLPAAAE